jgi:hypothetical protein
LSSDLITSKVDLKDDIGHSFQDKDFGSKLLLISNASLSVSAEIKISVTQGT